jgi:hypothetical protein
MLEWFLSLVLKILLKRAEKAASSAIGEIIKDKERGEVNEENVAKHQSAVSRAEKIKASLSLLNGTRSS